MGTPARLVRELTEDDVRRLIRPGVENYQRNAAGYRRRLATEPR